MLRLKKISFLFFAAFLTVMSSCPAHAATFFGENPESGVHELEFRKGRYQVYLPPDYDANTHYPVVILSYVYMDQMEVQPDQLFESWIAAANERGYIIIFPMPGGSIDFLDEWSNEFLKMIQIQYSMRREDVLMMGFGLGGHYAIHFSVGHPRDIGAVAVIGGSLEGPWKPMMTFKRGEERPHFYFSVGESDAVVPLAEVQRTAETLKNKKYQVDFEKYSGRHEYTDETTVKIADWFDGIRRSS